MRTGSPRQDNDLVGGVDEQGIEVGSEGMLDIPQPPIPDWDISTEMQRPKVMRAPTAPSRQEKAEHDITHCPFRAWCEVCVAGKSHAKGHLYGTSGTPEGEVPLVAFDYAFMTDKTMKEVSETYNAEVTNAEAEMSKSLKILVCRDRRSRCYAAIAIPVKGVGEDEYTTRRVLRFLVFLGYEKIILKSDQELGTVLR